MTEPGKEFYKSFSKLQMDIKPIKKTRTGHNWTYASLDDIWESILPIVDSHGFTIESSRRRLDGQMFLSTRLIHVETLQGIEDLSPLMAYLKSNYDDQEAGENVTYQRRYALTILLNLQMEEDRVEKRPRLDQNGAGLTKQTYKSTVINDIASSSTITPEQIKTINGALSSLENEKWLRARILEFNKVNSLEQLPQAKYESVLKFIVSGSKTQ